jgi:hypothetical protein
MRVVEKRAMSAAHKSFRHRSIILRGTFNGKHARYVLYTTVGNPECFVYKVIAITLELWYKLLQT